MAPGPALDLSSWRPRELGTALSACCCQSWWAPPRASLHPQRGVRIPEGRLWSPSWWRGRLPAPSRWARSRRDWRGHLRDSQPRCSSTRGPLLSPAKPGHPDLCPLASVYPTAGELAGAGLAPRGPFFGCRAGHDFPEGLRRPAEVVITVWIRGQPLGGMEMGQPTWGGVRGQGCGSVASGAPRWRRPGPQCDSSVTAQPECPTG